VSGNVVTLSVLAVLVACFAVCALLIFTQRWHGPLSLDHDLTGAQKIHHNPVPRVGGIGVAIGLLAGVLVGYAYGGDMWQLAIKLLACAAPVFAAGLLEDLTKRVSVKTRLAASFVSAGLAALLLDATLTRLDTPVLDELMIWGPFALLFTSFAVAGMTNAINIIDGLNGLASGAVGLMLAGLAGIAWQVGDPLVFKMCLWGIAAMSGFMLLNYPFGRIFLGDGGAYLAGFWLAECAVILLHRNPNLSTWAVLLCVMYPSWETIYSMYRRQFKEKKAAGAPDSDHFHHLVFIGLSSSGSPKTTQAWKKHGLASLLIWSFVLCCQVAANMHFRSTAIMAGVVLIFAVCYHLTYQFFERLSYRLEAANCSSQLSELTQH
jgi:UDP-N-acetylmuramyl pentapeptide phosphotransferase/UDP-N-acetylglucosamine-1-phosphate transferase